MVWNKGKHLSEETKRKMSEANKGRVPWNKGKKLGPRSEDTKRKLSRVHKSKKMSDEARKKMSISHMGHVVTEKTRRKISQSHKGKKRPKEVGRKISKSNIGKHCYSTETREKMSKACKGRKAWNKGLTNIYSEETRKQISIHVKRTMKDPKIREKISKANLFRMQNHKGPFKDTKPELKMKEILNDLNIPFEHQFRIKNHLFDFHILNTNILIEVDGDYFHGNPKKFMKLNEVQLKQKQRDIKHNKLAKINSFILLRFWENDILNNASTIINVILCEVEQ